MAKKPHPKNKKKEKKLPAPPPEPNPSTSEEKPFDFGGLPDRDLKKNLGGCG
jgi:hypothetical protein